VATGAASNDATAIETIRPVDGVLTLFCNCSERYSSIEKRGASLEAWCALWRSLSVDSSEGANLVSRPGEFGFLDAELACGDDREAGAERGEGRDRERDG
jgi:hypothetical protein